MTLNECPDIYQKINFGQDHLISSLILMKSMARHFLSSLENDIKQFSQFCLFFIQSTFKIFIDSQSFQEITLIFNSFYYIICNDPQFLTSINSEVLIGTISKFIFFSEFKNDEIYQHSLKCASKTLLLIFEKSIVPSDISPDLLISVFNNAFQLYTKELKPNTRNQLTRLICSLFDLKILSQYFLCNIQIFIESFIIPFFISTEIKCEIYDETFDLYDPYHSSIYIIQYLSNQIPEFSEFLNLYLIQYIQHFASLPATIDQFQLKNEAMVLLARTNLVSSSLHLSNESLLQIPLFKSGNEILRVIGFTIAANFSGVMPIFMFPVCLDHLTDQSTTVCQLSAVSAIKCLQNDEIDFDECDDKNCLFRLFEAYLTVSQNSDFVSISSSLKLLKRLLEISGSPGIFSNPILSLLLSQLFQLANDQNSDASLANKISKRICQLFEFNSIEPILEFSSDSFINELISIYHDFNDFYKENILSIFESSVEFCFSPIVSWKIVSIFEFEILFEDEMMVLRKLLISAKIHSIFDMNIIQFIIDKLFLKIGSDMHDDEIALNSLSDIISLFIGLYDETIDLLISQRIMPLILERIEINESALAISRLVSCIFIFYIKCEKQFDYQLLIDFWIDNAEYPYYCASSISFIPILLFDLNLCFTILLKVCDELAIFFKDNDQQTFDEFEFPEFSFSIIIFNFLKLTKFLKEKLPDFYQTFHSNTALFLDEILPQIVDSISS